jgi:hypothetical protein
MNTEPNTSRNLTYERQIAFLERQKREAMAPISAIETVVVALAKRDKAGNVALDADGVPVIVDKRVLKRDFIAREHDERIAKFKATSAIE